MSNHVANRRAIRELAPAEMDQVGGGLIVRGGGVTISQSLNLSTGYAIKRITGVAALLIKKL